MSGGHFDYNQRRLLDIASQIRELIAENEAASANHEGDPTCGYFFEPDTIQRFREAEHLLRQAYIYVQRIDRLVSWDDSADTFHERLRNELIALERDDEALSDLIEAFVAEYGYWGEHPKHSSLQWRINVEILRTRLGYWEWVESKLNADSE